MGGLNASTTPKIVHAVFAGASSVLTAGQTYYIGNGNKYVAPHGTEGVAGGKSPVPNLDPYKNYFITKMEVTFGTAPAAGESFVFTVRTDHATHFSMADSTLTATLTGDAATVTATGQAKIALDASDSVTIKIAYTGSATTTTTVLVVLTIEELN